MSSIRNWAVGSAISALILLSRVVAFLMVRVAEMLIDLLIEAGALALFSLVTIGALGRLVFRVNQPSPVERLSSNTTHVAKSQCLYPAADGTSPAVS